MDLAGHHPPPAAIESRSAAYDALDNAGRKVEIKTTTRSAILLSASGTESERLVVVVLSAEGAAEVFFDGPSELAWNAAGHPRRTARGASASDVLRLATAERGKQDGARNGEGRRVTTDALRTPASITPEEAASTRSTEGSTPTPQPKT